MQSSILPEATEIILNKSANISFTFSYLSKFTYRAAIEHSSLP